MTRRCPGTNTPGSAPAASPALELLRDELAALVREEAQRAVREALQDAPGSRPEFATLARYARSCGVGYSTLRRWARRAGLQRGPAGKFRRAELDALVAGGGTLPAAAPSPVADLAAARARKAADEILHRGGRS